MAKVEFAPDAAKYSTTGGVDKLPQLKLNATIAGSQSMDMRGDRRQPLPAVAAAH